MKAVGNNLLVRTLSGVVFAAVIVSVTLWLDFLLPALLTAICVGSMYEFYKMSRTAGLQPMRWYGVTIGLLLAAASYLILSGCLDAGALLLFIPLLFVFFIAEMYRRKENPIANIGAGVAGVVYVAVPVSLYIWIVTGGGISYSPGVALSYFILIWASDVGAYLVGTAVGRRRLFERISPKKSWEGFFGGLAFAVAASLAVSAVFSLDTRLWMILSLVVSVSGVLGDLVESMFKRSVGVKDSGNMMPGHGGFLDRFDSFLVSLPFAAAAIWLYYLCT